MKTIERPVYYCEFCKKHLFVKHAMIKHELNCYSNPKNFAQCSTCIHCEQIDVQYSFQGYYDGISCVDTTGTTRGFRCNAKGIEIYPFKAVKKGLIEKYPETFEGKQLMPNKDCPLYKEEDLEHFFNELAK